jgi:ferric iron reductase protein FhuF
MEHDVDLSYLEKQFYISLLGYEHPVFEMPAEALFDREQILAAMQAGGSIVRATGHELGVSFTGLAIHNLVAAACILYAYERKWLDMSLGNLTFQLETHGDHAHLAFKVNAFNWVDIPESGGEDNFRQLLDSYIREHITPAVRAVAENCGLKGELIWGQYGARFAYYMKHIAENEQNGEIRERFEAAARILMAIGPEAFERRRNPFIHTPRYIDSPYQPGGTMMLRSSCCMWYCKEDGVKCYNCPKLTSAERDEMRESIMAKAQ